MLHVELPSGEVPQELTECWTLEIPDDGASTHQIRYQAPQGQTEGVERCQIPHILHRYILVKPDICKVLVVPCG